MANRFIELIKHETHYGSYIDFSEYDDIQRQDLLAKKKLNKNVVIEDSMNTYVNILATFIVILGIVIGIGLAINNSL